MEGCILSWHNILHPFSALAEKVSECSFAALHLDHSLPPHIRFYCITYYTMTTAGLPLARVYAEPLGGCLLHCYAVISFAALYVSSVLWIFWDRASRPQGLNAHEGCIFLMYAENGTCV